MSTTVPKAPTGAVPAIGVPDSQDYPRLVYTAPYFAQTPLAELIEPSVIEAAEAVLPELVPPYVQGAADAAVDQRAVLLTGSTMSGPLYLNPAIPTQPSQAASMAYVDMQVSVASVPEVPPVPFGQTWSRQTGQWVPAVGFSDAPGDGTAYGRLNTSWQPVLPLSGGTVTGPLLTTTTGSPVSRAVQDRDTDFMTPKDYGAVCDGNSHPLSTRFSTLAAAQAVYPVATALTDEIDWCAIQTLINTGVPNLNLPAGVAVINHPLTSSNGIAVTGAGVAATTIVQTLAGADGWRHTSSGQFKAYNLSLKCNGAGGIAFNLTFTGSAAGLTMREVNIGGNGNQTTNYWHDGIRSVGPGLIDLNAVFVVGIQADLLTKVGNGLYIAPITPNVAGCYQISIKNSTFDYWYYGIVLDSAGNNLTFNIQGVILDWVNCVGCMQFVRVLSSALEIVLHKCQNAGYGAAIYAEAAYAVAVRDCYFINYAPNASRADIAALPQDVFTHNSGGTWWYGSNRIIVNPSATVGYIWNFQNNFIGATIRDNNVQTQSATATGAINISNGSSVIDERDTILGFWGSWPFVTNANAGGGARNRPAQGTLFATAAPAADQWQQPGSIIGFNYTAGRGAMDFINSHGAGAGGFYFYTTTSSPAATPSLLAQISNNAIFTCNGLITKLTAVSGTAYSLAVTDSSLVITPSATFTLTPGPASGANVNRSFYIKSTAAFAVNSNAPNIVQLTGGSSTTAILPATAGKWAWLQSDGTNWQIMAAN